MKVTLDTVLFDYRRDERPVVFLQIGAFDGVTNDPLYPLLEKHSLRGTLVEPQREVFDRLIANYAGFDEGRFTFVNAAVGAEDGERPLYRVRADAPGPPWLHQIASFDRDVVLKHANLVPGLEALIEVEQVRCLTFESLLSQCTIGPIDVLQIDAEGYDRELLRLFDVPARRPAIVRFEHKHLSRPDYADCLDLLKHEGYQIFAARDDTLAYLKQRGG